MLHDALHAVGLEPQDLPSEWSTVVTKKTRKKKENRLKFPNVPRLFLGKMYKRNYGPDDEEEWDIDVFRRCSNLCVDDTWKYTDVLDKLPAIPVDDIDDVKTKKKGRDTSQSQ